MARWNLRTSAFVGVLTLLVMSSLGCATNRQYAYRSQPLNVAIPTQQAVAVGAQDQRPDVLSGHEKEDYVGSQRGGYGNPWKVKTKGEEPLAPIFADQIAQAIQKQSAKATSIRIALKTQRQQAIDMLKATGAQRLLLLTINQWDSDTYVNTDLDYDLVLEVFDSQGHLLASSRLKGKDTLKNGAWNPAGDAEDQAPQAFCERLGKLCSDPKIVTAMK